VSLLTLAELVLHLHERVVELEKAIQASNEEKHQKQED